MDVHNHNTILAKLCRICGENIILKHGYKTAKAVTDFSFVLYNNFDVDVNEESEDVYPKFLCSNCHKKIQRIGKGNTQEKKFAVKFSPHLDTGCSICHKHQRNSMFNVKDLDKELCNLGFQKLQDAKYKRIYAKLKLNDERGRIVTEILIKVTFENSWTCLVYGRDVSDYFDNILPQTISDVQEFTNFFKNHGTCKGIHKYEDVIRNRLVITEPFTSNAGSFLVARVENSEHVALDNFNEYKYVRHKDCLYFVEKDVQLCKACADYANNRLSVFRWREENLEPEEKKRRTSDSSHVNYRYLSKEELVERLTNIQKKKKEVICKLTQANEKIKERINVQGVGVNDEQHGVLQDIITSPESKFEFDEETPQWLLWQQQKLQASKKNSKGMRWHPLIIRWCLSIYFTSSAAYKQMSNKNLNFLRLPSVDTLRNYTNFTTVQTGFNPDIIKSLAQDAQVQTNDERGRQVVICFDEMQIKSNLVYHKATGKLIGFTEMGDINEEFRIFGSSLTESSTDLIDREFATHVLVYMVRGLFSSLLCPFGYFASNGMRSSQLYTCTLEAVRVLSAINFQVRALVSDGAAANRKFYEIMAIDNEKNFYWTWNPHSSPLKLYFFSDVPHLLKTTRNCFENSKWNKNVRNMHLDGQDITWKHIVDLYEEDLGLKSGRDVVIQCQAPGLRKLHKLTEEHIKLTSRSRMTVKLAAQVLSQTTAKALISQGRHDTKSTIHFIDMFDRVFDCLNVSKLNRGRHSKKELDAYENLNDWRFKFLSDDFINGFLIRWENQAKKTKLPKKDQKRLLLSAQTRKGWKITVSSFVDLAKELVQIEGVRFLLSEKFSQDPLEEHFGRQRRRGGCNENPNLLEFGQQELALNVMRTDLMQEMKGNTRGADRENIKIDIHDTRTLNKKKSKR